PFFKKIESLVDTLVGGFDGDVAIFQDALTDFLAFVEMDRRRASLVEQRTIDAEDGRAKAELARQNVHLVLQSKVGARALPDVVTKLLNDGWSNVLFLICLKEGTDSESWQLALRTVDDLIESVSPVGNLNDRARLLRMLPTLLKNLRSGLSKIGFNPFEMNQLFSDLEQIHLQRLKREEAVVPIAPVVEAKKPVTPEKESAPEAPKVAAPAEAVIPAAPVAKPPVVEIIRPSQPATESRTLDEVLGSREEMHSIQALDRELSAQFGDFDELESIDAQIDAAAAAAGNAPDAGVVAESGVQAAAAPDEDAKARADRVAMEHVDRLQV